MKIAIPVDENKMETTICPSFGRAPFFLIYDVDTKNADFIINNASTSQGGAGIKTAQMLADLYVNTVVTPRCGENSAHVIYSAGIKIYKSVHLTVTETIDDFINNQLHELNDIHSGFHHHGEK